MPSTQMGGESVRPVEEWLAAARGGDENALGQAMETCRRYLLLVADRRLDGKHRPKGGASDIVQETFLDAQRDFGCFEGRTEPELRSWLRTILRHNLLSFVRRYRQSKRDVAREVPLAAVGDAGAHPLARVPSPSRHAILREEASCLVEAMDRLPERARQLVHWRHQEHCSFEEIGRRLGVSSDAARMAWARSIRRLQHEVGEPARG